MWQAIHTLSVGVRMIVSRISFKLCLLIGHCEDKSFGSINMPTAWPMTGFAANHQ